MLDNDYKGFPSSPLDSMRVTVAHEVQPHPPVRLRLYQDIWLFEDTATWMEDQVLSDINDYLNYLPAFAKSSDTPMTGSSIKVYSRPSSTTGSPRYGRAHPRRVVRLGGSQA